MNRMKKATTKLPQRALALLLSLAFVFSLSVNAFADDGIPEDMADRPGIQKHEITLELEPKTEIEDGIQPLMWDNGSYNVSGTDYTGYFTIPDRYFAFECSATNTSGGTVNGKYAVALMYGNDLVAATTRYVNGQVHKVDWIEPPHIGESYRFKLYNYTNTTIKINLTYYSWK